MNTLQTLVGCALTIVGAGREWFDAAGAAGSQCAPAALDVRFWAAPQLHRQTSSDPALRHRHGGHLGASGSPLVTRNVIGYTLPG